MYDARSFGITVAKDAGVEQYCHCPFHEDHSPSASFNKVKGVLYCYVCGKGWNLVQLETALEVEVGGVSQEPPDFDLIIPENHLDLGVEKYVPYFEERRIRRNIARLYGLRWKDSEPSAAVLPITNIQGNVVAAAYRYLSGPTRYKVFGKPTPVWPMHILTYPWNGPNRTVIVTEGAWSAMRIATVKGLGRRSVALLGAKASQATVDVLKPFRVAFLYDGDAAGERACRKMRALFPTAHSWTVSKSPDDMTDDEIEELFERLDEYF